jgi:hypothetical protein
MESYSDRQTDKCLLRAVHCRHSHLAVQKNFKLRKVHFESLLVCLFSCLRVCVCVCVCVSFCHHYCLCTVNIALLLPRALSLLRRNGILFNLLFKWTETMQIWRQEVRNGERLNVKRRQVVGS